MTERIIGECAGIWMERKKRAGNYLPGLLPECLEDDNFCHELVESLRRKEGDRQGMIRFGSWRISLRRRADRRYTE